MIFITNILLQTFGLKIIEIIIPSSLLVKIFLSISKEICVPAQEFFIKKANWEIKVLVTLRPESANYLVMTIIPNTEMRILLSWETWVRQSPLRWVSIFVDHNKLMKLIWICSHQPGIKELMMEEGMRHNQARCQTMKEFWKMDKVCNLCRQKIIIETGCAVLLILVANLNKIFQETKLKFFHHLLRVK